MNSDVLMKVINKFINLPYSFSYSANTINILFYDNDKFAYSFWIDPSWRIIKNNQIINSSITCPRYNDYEYEEEYTNTFYEWCAKTNYLNDLKITKVIINKPIHDLEIHWQDSTILHVYMTDNSDWNWYVRHQSKKVDYLVFSNAIKTEDIKDFEL